MRYFYYGLLAMLVLYLGLLSMCSKQYKVNNYVLVGMVARDL